MSIRILKMNVEADYKKDILFQVLLDKECSDFVLQVCKDLNITKSHAIRSIIRTYKNAKARGFKDA
jgi:hypothetical protein